jgi:hypothetical protein
MVISQFAKQLSSYYAWQLIGQVASRLVTLFISQYAGYAIITPVSHSVSLLVAYQSVDATELHLTIVKCVVVMLLKE